MNPYDCAHELARAIRESEGFRAMKAAKEKIDPDEKAKEMLNDFHLKQLQFEQKRILGQEPTEEEQDGLHKLYEILQMHQPVREYLQAEYQLSVLMQDVQKVLGDLFLEVSVTE
ncbi:YlbF family regulator [Ferroacidibacillus organovorans]|uniref:YlbF family regulator n=1 Tax=Ferroacidibacillus organovorans TaxID=1765683 RepID=UPI0007A881FC|nr:YlbF family regulator [Ferroacidibacillus organovorans]KYP81885.1 hypothetical protein AYJ22_15855 [Ferroacidibacillus organovorans]